MLVAGEGSFTPRGQIVPLVLPAAAYAYGKHHRFRVVLPQGENEMQQIIVPLDGSALAETIMPCAAMWARTSGAALTLVMVVTPAHNLHPWPESTPLRARQEWERAERDQADAYLQGVAQRWAAPDLPLHWEVLIAEHIAEQIVMRAHTPDVAMIAMTTHGRSGWSEWAFGSIAQKVLHAAPVPLLLRRGRGDTSTATTTTPALRTILVPLDGSAFAEQALPLAQQLAQASNATLVLVAAVPPIGDMGLALAGVEPMWMLADSYATDDREKDYLNNIAQRVRATGITVHTCCMWDAPAQAILRTSTEEGADLVVMTTHGRTGVQRLWLGSVAHKVLHAADVPVLLVRAHAASTEEKATG